MILICRFNASNLCTFHENILQTRIQECIDDNSWGVIEFGPECEHTHNFISMEYFIENNNVDNDARCGGCCKECNRSCRETKKLKYDRWQFCLKLFCTKNQNNTTILNCIRFNDLKLIFI